jgi:hypothetical protein
MTASMLCQMLTHNGIDLITCEQRDGQPAAGDGQPAAGDGQPAAGDGMNFSTPLPECNLDPEAVSGRWLAT